MSATDKTLLELRTEIDEVDQRLVRLINDRSKLAVEHSRLKRAERGTGMDDRTLEAVALEKVVAKSVA